VRLVVEKARVMVQKGFPVSASNTMAHRTGRTETDSAAAASRSFSCPRP
jgi:hypothetical protein